MPSHVSHLGSSASGARSLLGFLRIKVARPAAKSFLGFRQQ